ncbi:MAG: permease-like cell division protein FtsX [Bacteroidaceae bacterium]|nr:permease-like cell division protein FtsX [Bacteroidaceae bacterium]
MKKHSHFSSTQFITPAISTTLVLLLLGTIVFFVLTAHNLSNYVKENINISILISDELDSKQIKNLQKEFGKTDYVKSIDYISKEQALIDATTDMGTDPEEFLGYNPFTASFEVKLKAEHASSEEIDKIVSEVKKHPSVVDVIYQKDLIKSVNRNLQKLSIVLLILAILFTYISFVLINNTVRLSIFSKRFIINTMKLVGAKWSFIRRPFLANGFTLGIISAIIADALLYAGYVWAQKYEHDLNLVVNDEVLIIVGASVLVFGLLITFLCTYISVQKYLKMSTNKLYYV